MTVASQRFSEKVFCQGAEENGFGVCVCMMYRIAEGLGGPDVTDCGSDDGTGCRTMRAR